MTCIDAPDHTGVGYCLFEQGLPEPPADKRKMPRTFFLSPGLGFLVIRCQTMLSNPNWPSKTGNPSGKGRGNNPAKKKILQFLFILCFMHFAPNEVLAQECGLSLVTVESYYPSLGEMRQVKHFWSINEGEEGLWCNIGIAENVRFDIYFEESIKSARNSLLPLVDKYKEWSIVAQQNHVTDLEKRFPTEIVLNGTDLPDEGKGLDFHEVSSEGAFFKVKGEKRYCALLLRASNGEKESSKLYGLWFASPEELQGFISCLDQERLKKLEWGNWKKATGYSEKEKQLFQ